MFILSNTRLGIKENYFNFACILRSNNLSGSWSLGKAHKSNGACLKIHLHFVWVILQKVLFLLNQCFSLDPTLSLILYFCVFVYSCVSPLLLRKCLLVCVPIYLAPFIWPKLPTRFKLPMLFLGYLKF